MTAGGRRPASAAASATHSMPLLPAKAGAGPAGSTTVKRSALPRSSQPSRSARPSCRSRRGAPRRRSPRRRSRFADRIDHRGGHRLLGVLAAPEDELKGGVEALALIEGDVDQILDLLDAGAKRAAQQHGVAKGRGVVVGGEIEMAEPELLVDEGEQLVDGAAPPLRHLHVEAAGEMERADLLLPDEIEAVVAPAALDLDDHLLIAGAVMRPFIRENDLLDEIDGVGCGRRRLGVDRGHPALLLRAAEVRSLNTPDLVRCTAT